MKSGVMDSCCQCGHLTTRRGGKKWLCEPCATGTPDSFDNPFDAIDALKMNVDLANEAASQKQRADELYHALCLEQTAHASTCELLRQAEIERDQLRVAVKVVGAAMGLGLRCICAGEDDPPCSPCRLKTALAEYRALSNLAIFLRDQRRNP